MDSRLLEVVKAARDRTLRGGLEWRAFDDESFRAPAGEGYLHLQRGHTTVWQDGVDRPAETFDIQVSDARGRIVAEGTATEGNDADYADCAGLFDAARRSALKADQVLDNILRALRTPA